jgi:hypothetical protein
MRGVFVCPGAPCAMARYLDGTHALAHVVGARVLKQSNTGKQAGQVGNEEQG